MARAVRICLIVWVMLSVSTLTGCGQISIAPSCPDSLEVGQSGTVSANEQNPGAIPTYHWEVLPSDAGDFDNPDAPDTTFEALKEGDAVIQLTASDGLFQMIAQCPLTVTMTGLTDVAVLLEVDPNPLLVGETGLVFCGSVGGTEAVRRGLEQIGGALVELTLIDEGFATFVTQVPGNVTFRCIGTSSDGQTSEPSVVTISVTPSTG